MTYGKKMNQMVYNDFIKLVDQTSNQFNWRRGQSLMNVLHGVWPEKYQQITGTDRDCYYDDNKIKTTIELLIINWNPDNK
jgi:hypothetical protein